jgi:hypothetical protein
MTFRHILLAFCIAGTAAGLPRLAAAEKIDGRPFAEFAEHFDRVRQAAGLEIADAERLSETKRAETLHMADRAVAGFQPFYNNEYIEVGLSGIDWTGGQRNHQEWVAMLNRFYRYLPALGDAYLITGDEKYPARAKLLMEEFRQFVAEKNRKKFFDPQKNNLLNISVRMQNWSDALRRMGSSPCFTDQWVAEILDFMNWQLDCLDEATRPGLSNFQIFQSDALTMTSLYFPNLPGAAKRLRHGAETMKACLQMQFRPDGTHGENTHGYHLEMLDIAIRYNHLHRIFPEIPPGLPDGIIAGGLDFAYLSAPWGFNDHRLRKDFPRFALHADPFRGRADKAGMPGWRPPESKAFPDAGLFFAGNQNEHLVFDAAKVGSGHSHHARLQVLYAAFGEILVSDCGITTYDRNSPYHIAGHHTANHATVNPDTLIQRRADAQPEYWLTNPNYAVFSGRFEAGYLNWTSGRYVDREPDFRGTHHRAVIWLAERYLLLFDRTVGKAGFWNYTFPTPEQDQIETTDGAFRTRNADRPNFTVKMLRQPGKTLSQRVFCGEPGEVYRGWRGILTGGVPMPLLQFSVAGSMPMSAAVILIAAAPAGQPAGGFRVTGESDRHVEFENPDGSIDFWLFHPAAATDTPLTAVLRTGGGEVEVTFRGEHLLIRRDRSGAIAAIFVDRGRQLIIDGHEWLSEAEPVVTGYLRQSPFSP